MADVVSICRICNNFCGIVVEVEDGRAISVRGDSQNPYSQGYSCLKGRSLAAFHYGEKRLLRPLKRGRDGAFTELASADALDEIAERLSAIVARHGPNAIANYTGTLAAYTSSATLPVATGFMDALGSWMNFSPATIDQPGRTIARAIQGAWQAPFHTGADSDVILLFGINSFVSCIGLPSGHIPKWLAAAQQRGLKLIVVDPRRSDLARRADQHIQPRPGTDTAIAAALINVIISEGLVDEAFLAANASGVERLRESTAPFTPEAVGEFAGIDPEDLRRAARTFATAGRGYALSGTGPNMSQPGTLLAYLLLDLDCLCGHLLREGEVVPNPGALAPKMAAIAQPMELPVRDDSKVMHARNLAATLAGPALASLPEQMRLDGPDRVRALIVCGGNPVSAWPDQINTIAGLEALELLVVIDPFMTDSARMADYVLPPRMALETPTTSQFADLCLTFGHGPGRTYAQYADAAVEPPAGSDLLDDWQVYYELARRMGLDLHVPDLWGVRPPIRVGIDEPPTSEDMLSMVCADSVVPLDEVKRHPHGRVYDDVAVKVQPREPGNSLRLQLADEEMMAQLGREADRLERPAMDVPNTFALISRRAMHTMNSCYNAGEIAGRRSWNPAYFHSADLDRLGIAPGDTIRLRSARAQISAVAEADDNVRPGVISMSHCFGSIPGRDDDPQETGSSTSRLIDVSTDYDPYSGQPRMSNISVKVERAF